MSGNIRKIINKTDFDLHHPRNQNFVSQLEGSIQNPLDCEDDLSQLGLFVSNYKESGYPDNKWRDASVSPDVAEKIRYLLHALLRQAKELHEQKRTLPSKEITSLLAHSLMRDWAAGFLTSPERRSVVNTMIGLINGMIDAYAMAGINNDASFILDDLYAEGGNIHETFRLHHGNARHLERISKINTLTEGSEIIKIFLNHLEFVGPPDSKWQDIMRVVSLGMQKKNLPLLPEGGLPYLENSLEEMRNSLTIKRDSDVRKILSNYLNRKSKAHFMKNEGYLKQKKQGSKMPSTIRDVLTKRWSSYREIFPVMLTTPSAMSQMFPFGGGGFGHDYCR